MLVSESIIMIKTIRLIYNKLLSLYYKKKIKNVPTIISRDCCGGVIYKNLSLDFITPTIKLYFTNKDFILFCMHLNDFVETELLEFCDNEHSYPIGVISCKWGSVKLHFMHSDSFSESKEAWDRRKKRIKYDNIFVLLNAEKDVEENVVKDFLKIPYRKVLLSSNVDTTKYNDCINLKCYEEGYTGPLVKFTKKFGVKRYLDEYNWIDIFK